MANTNGFKRYDVIARAVGIFFRADEYVSKQATIKSGQVLKAMTFLQSDTEGKLIAHQGINEKALVTFADITAGQTLILGGLTFTAGAGGTTKESLVEAFSGLAASTGYVAANTANPVADGSFTAGTLTGYKTVKGSTANTVLFISTTPYAGVTDLADTGTATNPTISITAASEPAKSIAGVLMYDVNASAGDVEASIYLKASFFASALKWSADVTTETVENGDLTTTAVTDYDTGCTTDNLKKKFVENSGFSDIGFQHAGEVY